MRIIGRLDVKNNHVIKGIHLEGLRKVGDPVELALKYYSEGVDELIFMDAVASLYDRNNLFHIIEAAAKEVFVPLTIGGGVRSLQDIEMALASGADKVAINTAAVKTPPLVNEATRVYGSQCIVGSIEAKSTNEGWEAYIDNGRERTGLDVVEWARELEERGVGELLITSIDNEGTKRGFDTRLAKVVNSCVSIPVIVSGGMGHIDQLKKLHNEVSPSACAVAGALHYDMCSLSQMKQAVNK